MTNIFDISGKNAVVTGGAGVLGGSIAKHLVEQGVNVVVLGRHAENVNEKVEELKAIMVEEHIPNHIFPLFNGE